MEAIINGRKVPSKICMALELIARAGQIKRELATLYTMPEHVGLETLLEQAKGEANSYLLGGIADDYVQEEKRRQRDNIVKQANEEIEKEVERRLALLPAAQSADEAARSDTK